MKPVISSRVWNCPRLVSDSKSIYLLLDDKLFRTRLAYIPYLTNRTQAQAGTHRKYVCCCPHAAVCRWVATGYNVPWNKDDDYGSLGTTRCWRHPLICSSSRAEMGASPNKSPGHDDGWWCLLIDSDCVAVFEWHSPRQMFYFRLLFGKVMDMVAGISAGREIRCRVRPYDMSVM